MRVWNEENIQRFWAGRRQRRRLHRAAQGRLPRDQGRADPAAKVVFGGLSLERLRFVQAAYDAGAKGYFDVMATHPYTGCGAAPTRGSRNARGHITADSFLAYRELRQAMVAHGDAKPIWFTEFGWTTTGDVWRHPGPQADYLTRAFKLVEQDPYVEVASGTTCATTTGHTTPTTPSPG